LGEFSPNGRSFTFGQFYKYFRSSPKFWPNFPYLSIDYVLILIFLKILNSSGTDVMIFKIFSPQNLAKKLAFLTQNKAKF
jgi:hypothetical protein